MVQFFDERQKSVAGTEQHSSPHPENVLLENLLWDQGGVAEFDFTGGNFIVVHLRRYCDPELPLSKGGVPKVAEVNPGVVLRTKIVTVNSSLHKIELGMLAAGVLREDGVRVKFRVRRIREDSFHPVQVFKGEQTRAVIDENNFHISLISGVLAKRTFHFFRVRIDHQRILKEVKCTDPLKVVSRCVQQVGAFLETSQVEEGRHDGEVSVVT